MNFDQPIIIMRPEKVLFPIDKIKIQRISFGWAHCLFLASFSLKTIFI